jgi:adenylate cyclase class 2
LEVTVSSFATLHKILEQLDYRAYFRYEKYRTEFKGTEGFVATFDETPIGNFLELEGDGVWIDEMAAKLGFNESEYILESYGRLYLTHCERLGVKPSNMVFA